MGALRAARQVFYRRGGPWLRCKAFEALGSRRYSRPALYGMEERLAQLVLPGKGTFVEAGAHDGFTQSNTYYLERFEGWRGVLVEAVPELARKAERRRPASTVVQAALVSPAREGEEVTIHFGDLTSTMGNPRHAQGGLNNAGRQAYEIQVPGRTLSSIIDDAEIGAPDLLVLDVEGQEPDVLMGLDMPRHSPRLLIIEMLQMKRQRPLFDELLGDHYDFVEAITPDDALYRSRSPS